MGKVYYNQADPRWRNHPYPAYPGYEDKTVGTSGCGPTCVAMVVSSCRETITPDVMCDISRENGYRVPGGTDDGLFQYAADRWNIELKRVYSSYEAHAACKEGYFVVIACGEGLWTTGGHFILAVGAKDDRIEIYDPYLYQGKFDQYGRQGKVDLEGVSAWVQIDTFKEYSNAQRFFAYKVNGVEPGPEPEPPTPPQPTPDPVPAWVNTNSLNLNVRNAPGGDVIGSLPKGTEVLVYEVVNGWARIGDGQYVSNDYLKYDNPTPGRDTVGQERVFKDYTYIWSQPDLSGTRYDYLPNTTVTILENVSANVDKIQVNQTGRIGYVDISVYTVCDTNTGVPNTVGEIRILKGYTYLWSNPDLSGTRYDYLPQTRVEILENVSASVDKIYVLKTGRVAYVSTDAYA